MNYLMVALGGAVGASLRYSLGLISIKDNFPYMTFIINVLGAIVMGFFVGITMSKEDVNPNTVLFVKVGLCGGFTTFSTFSLELFNMIEDNHIVIGFLYATLSVVTCVAGIWIGRKLAAL